MLSTVCTYICILIRITPIYYLISGTNIFKNLLIHSFSVSETYSTSVRVKFKGATRGAKSYYKYFALDQVYKPLNNTLFNSKLKQFLSSAKGCLFCYKRNSLHMDLLEDSKQHANNIVNRLGGRIHLSAKLRNSIADGDKRTKSQ